MITILHGDHQVASRNRLVEIRNQAKSDDNEIISLEGSRIDLTDIIQALEAGSLFNDKRLVIIENLLGSLKAGKNRDEIIAYLVNGGFDTDLILWEKKSVGRQIIKLKKQSHVTVEEFKMPTVIFKFVDNLIPKNHTQLLGALNETLNSAVVPEILFTMMVRQFRLMIALETDAQISEAKRLAPWQRGKIKKQASYFSIKQLTALYKNLLVIDYQTKTGRSPITLTTHIEQFIINL